MTFKPSRVHCFFFVFVFCCCCCFFVVVFFVFVVFFSPGIYPSPLLFSVTGAVRLPVWGLLAGISGLPATGGLPALRGTQLPYAMLLLSCVWKGERAWVDPYVVYGRD